MKNDIINAFMHHVLEHGKRPASIYSFAKQLELTEQEIYAHFTSFDAIEKSIWGQFFDNTLDLLKENDEYQSFTATNKLLSFYYTFFEILTANRSYVLIALDKGTMHPKVQSQMGELRKKLQTFVKELEINSTALPNEQLNELRSKGMSKVGWSHFVFMLDFWMKDTSTNFEKTDILIEKSVNTGVRFANSEPLKDVIDLGKFLFKEIKQR